MKIHAMLLDFNRTVKNDGWLIDASKTVNRLYYVHSGCATVYYAKKTHTLTAGNVYLLPPNDEFQGISCKDFDHTYFDYYCSPPLRLDSFTEINASLYGLHDFFSLMDAVIANISLHTSTANYFLNAILSHIDDNIKLPYINDNIITSALELIQKNTTSITTKELSTLLCLNESYFIKRFSMSMGIPPMKYIRSMRLAEGSLMLKDGMNVTLVAEKCGYSTPNAFWKAIRKEFGCSPSELKK